MVSFTEYTKAIQSVKGQTETSKLQRKAIRKRYLSEASAEGKKLLSPEYRKQKAFRSSGIGQFFSGVSKYQRAIQGRGRPKGSTDPRYAAYGGVYGYRKQLAARLSSNKALARAEAYRQAAQTQQFQRQQMARQIPQEQRTIPNTSGFSSIGNYMKEIEDASNEVP